MDYIVFHKLVRIKNIPKSRLQEFLDDYKVRRRKTQANKCNGKEYCLKDVDKMIEKEAEKENKIKENHVDIATLPYHRSNMVTRLKEKNIKLIKYKPLKGRHKYYIKNSDLEKYLKEKQILTKQKDYNMSIDKDIIKDIMYFLKEKHKRKITRIDNSFRIEDKNIEMIYFPNDDIFHYREKGTLHTLFNCKEEFKKMIEAIKKDNIKKEKKLEKEKIERAKRTSTILYGSTKYYKKILENNRG